MTRRVLTVIGTRPEAIKLAPVIHELRRQGDRIQPIVCVTAQHREMLDRVLALFGIRPDVDLNLMRPRQSLAGFFARAMVMLGQLLRRKRPDVVLVQGDTSTMLAAALSAFYTKIPVGHVEAGLRTGDLASPFPEEMHRQVVATLARYHFVPTPTALEALLREGIPRDRTFLTGNTVIDALGMILERPAPPGARAVLGSALGDAPEGCRLVLVTAHRRESFGAGIARICSALHELVLRNPEVRVVYPVHPNPRVRDVVRARLGSVRGIVLTDPLEYDVLVHLMKAAYLILTDSGGIQEEAPALGKPVLVLRETTERPDGIVAGVAKLVGTEPARIVAESERLLSDAAAYAAMARGMRLYGDGKAAARIVDVLLGVPPGCALADEGNGLADAEAGSAPPEPAG